MRKCKTISMAKKNEKKKNNEKMHEIAMAKK